ncbi:MAG: hypothetical protein JXA09_03430 [Anaerolineae bacterium]|nr:hypothetical protein [Anaerolineae bacterium]
MTGLLKVTLKRDWLCAVYIACALLYGATAPAQVRADDPIAIQVNAHDYRFGEQIRFQLQASGETPIESITLSYRTSDAQATTVEALSFAAARSVHVEHVHDIGQRYVQPFVEVTYWWTLVDARGASMTTEPLIFAYVDDRFDWQALNQDGIVLHWYAGDLPIAQQTLDVAIEAVSRAAIDLPIELLQEAIEVYLYADAADLGLTLPAGLPAGDDAITLYETNTVLVSYAPQETNIPALRRTIPHEVTHALIHAVTPDSHTRVPRWVSEGLSTSIEYAFVPDPDAQDLLDDALAARRTISLHTLCAEFPNDSEQKQLAYVESASVIDYIRDLHGRQALRDLVAAYADGATCDGGIQRALGMSMERLQVLWMAHEAPQGRWAAFWERSGAWMVLILLLAAVPIVTAVIVHPWKKRTT